jgi:hypothetical protein
MPRHLVLLLAFVTSVTTAAGPPPATQEEVAHLLDFLSRSGCDFNRNGSWYGPAKAVDHLNQKYQYLRERGLVESTEDFIARAASKSSMSGKPYQVRCAGAPPVRSGEWMRAELERHRAGRNKR